MLPETEEITDLLPLADLREVRELMIILLMAAVPGRLQAHITV